MEKVVRLSRLKMFGCISYAHVNAYQRNRLVAKLKKCTFIGYNSGEFCYQFWDNKNQNSLKVELHYSMKKLCIKTR